MKNLQAEMKRYGISNTDIQRLLGVTERTVINKVNGITAFDIGEALKIRNELFPSLRVEYLFAPDMYSSKEA